MEPSASAPHTLVISAASTDVSHVMHAPPGGGGGGDGGGGPGGGGGPPPPPPLHTAE
jgi:hypothetical protein